MNLKPILFITLFSASFPTGKAGVPERNDSDTASLSKQLEEVVVIAYGTGKKSALTGATSVISPKEIANRPLASVTSAILGKAPGVQSTLSDGQPGSSPGLRIRGFGSINASNEPLYVVDGTVYTGPISNINPADVASVTILKDAAATALYGSSAGNGVVQITTRRASGENDTRVNLRISQGFSQRGIPEYDRVGVWDYYPLQWEMLKNQYIHGSEQSPDLAAANATANLYTQLGKFNIFKNVPNDAIVLSDGTLNPLATSLLYNDFDWAGAAYRNGYRGEYSLSYSTRTDKSDTYASLNYLDDRGPMISTGYKRYGGRINYNIHPVEWFESGINLSITYAKASTPMTNMTFTTAKGNMTSFLRKMAPIYPVYLHNEDGSFKLDERGNKIYDYTSSRISLSGRHTIAEALWNKRGYTRDAYTGHAYVAVYPIKGLKITVNGSLNSDNDRAQVYYNTIVADGAPAGRIQITNERFHTYTFNELIEYRRAFGDHNAELLLGHENYDYTYQYQYVYKQKQIMEGLYELENFSTLSKLTSLTDRYKKEGWLARGNYNFRDTYFLSASFRRDGSSRFSRDVRWGNFWSVGGAWRIDQERFMKNLTWINSLKLRGSYGETGNDGILKQGEPSYYPWQTLYNTGINNSKEPGVYFSVYGNGNLKWETLQSADVAVDFRVFNRFSGSIEYFRKNSNDLLFNVPVPLSSGVASIWQNLGKVSNNGMEIDLGYDYLQTSDWTGVLNINGTWLKNRVKSMPDGLPEIVSSTMKVSAGHSIYDFWLREYQGVDPETGDQLLGDYHYCGSSVPKFYGGFGTQLRYKNFQLDLAFSYGLGGKIYDVNYADLMTNQIGFAMHRDALNAWKQPGDKTNVPRLDASKSSEYALVSDRFLVNGNYLNFQSFSVSYDLPRQLLSKAHIRQATLAVCGENLVQWNHRRGLNALSNFEGYTYNLYAPSRVFTFNINLTF
ncbi:MAG: SusC/RagA family TonB-linked outer membrane protein [Bacteroidales bacterium]